MIKLIVTNFFLIFFDNKQINIFVTDVNDNAPQFVFKYPNDVFTNGKYYAAIAMEAPISSILLQVHAEDNDSGVLGQVIYEIMDETNSGKYFTIERKTGIIRTDRMISIHQLPLRLIITARDNPGQPKGYQETSCQVVVMFSNSFSYYWLEYLLLIQEMTCWTDFDSFLSQ